MDAVVDLNLDREEPRQIQVKVAVLCTMRGRSSLRALLLLALPATHAFFPSPSFLGTQSHRGAAASSMVPCLRTRAPISLSHLRATAVGPRSAWGLGEVGEGRPSFGGKEREDGVGQAKAGQGVFSTVGMSVEEFWERSEGTWESRRASQNFAGGRSFAYQGPAGKEGRMTGVGPGGCDLPKEVFSTLRIEAIPSSDPELQETCTAAGYLPESCAAALRVFWRATSDWDGHVTVTQGDTVVAVVKTTSDREGVLLRSRGYAEAVLSVGTWEMLPDGSFLSFTEYKGTMVEERFSFASPDSRIRVASVRSKGGEEVTVASLTTETRAR